MLQRAVRGSRLLPYLLPATIAVACSGSDERSGRVGEAILGGALVDSGTAATLLLENPGAFCSAILIAPRLVATARHCVAQLAEGNVSCTPDGKLAYGSTGGALGANFDAGSLTFFTPESVASGAALGAPDATGVQILSTGSKSVCSDDLAFVVLDHQPAGISPVPVRYDRPTMVDEPVSVWGYGLSEEAAARVALRVRDDAQILAVGPSMPTSLPQPAPLRSVLIGNGAIGCNGDSGGPILSGITGALVAVVSIGTQSLSGGTCSPSRTSSTTGPLLSNYPDLVNQAFAAAEAAPILEPSSDASVAEAGTDDDATPAADGAGDPQTGDAASVAVEGGGGCEVGRQKHGPGTEGFAAGFVAAVFVIARRRRG